ncbi:quinate permease [Niveomyces insectorum RCEF 264]|uniref:Quinate permease n=1 Tax=Niveomyces insectorum RCEF 264 TaxID=1081102 RepID=A0A167UXQ3_9HYPO|nr:quinate permease [Niveomyces insectorum RCEF 264]
MSTFTQHYRAWYVTALACMASFLFAYDTGIIGGILTLPSFAADFHTKGNTSVASNSTSLLQAGAFFSCFFIYPFTARYGRRWSIVLASVVFCIGGIMQVVDSHSLGVFYAARVISGVGVGFGTVLTPLFTAEMAPKEIRGKLGSLFQFFFTCGVMFSYWIDYGVSLHVPNTSARQWQIPVGLQLVPGAVLGLGMLFTKESPRWLAMKRRDEEALASLIWVRGGDRLEVREEFEQILAGIQEEERASEGYTRKELWMPVNRWRIVLIIAIQIDAPQVFTAVGAGSNNLFFSGFFGVAKVVSCGIFVVFLIERVGRRGALLAGSFAMGSLMLIVALIVETHPPKSTGPIASTSVAAIVMIYLEAMAYNMSWGPVPWLYMAEILPSRIREPGVAIGTATQWLFNFVFSQITPYAVRNLGWRAFLMFCIFNWSLVAFSWFFIKETKGKALEEMEAVFNNTSTAIDVETIHQKVQAELAPTEKTSTTPQEEKSSS